MIQTSSRNKNRAYHQFEEHNLNQAPKSQNWFKNLYPQLQQLAQNATNINQPRISLKNSSNLQKDY